MRAVDLTVSVGFLSRVRSPKICLEHPRIERWYMSKVTGKWVVQRLRGILEKQSLGMTRTVEGNRFREEGNYNKTVSRVRSGKSNADAKDKRWRPVHACFTRSCDQLLSTSAGLPHDVEAVLCKLYSHHTHAAVHTKISTNTPTKEIKRTIMFEYKSRYTSIDAYKT